MNKRIILLALSFILLGGVKMEASEQGFNVSLSVKRIDHIPGIIKASQGTTITKDFQVDLGAEFAITNE